jgi:hypothetical protein
VTGVRTIDQRRRPFPPHGAEAGGILPWSLIRIALVLLVLGVCVYDGVSIGWSALQTEDTANQAARKGSSAWEEDKNADDAYRAAAASAGEKGVDLPRKDFTVAPDGTVKLIAHHQAQTLVVGRIGALRHLAETQSHAKANAFLGGG